MKKLFLIWPNDVSKQSALYPPLGIASIASVMERKNYPVHVLDLSFDENWEQLRSLNVEGGIYGISFTSSLYSNTKKCIFTIRSNDKKALIVLGGAHCSVLPKETLKEIDADIICIGEAEHTFPLVVEALQNHHDLKRINGIAFRDKENEVAVTPPAEMIPNLDILPIPNQSKFPCEKYFKEKGFRELSIITSRGCPGRCIFCQPTIKKMFGNKVRYHGIDYVLKQIRMLIDDFKLDFFVVSDDTFISNKKRALEFCQKMISEKIRIFWRCQTRVDLLDREIIRMLKKAGCFVIALGVESGNQDILNHLRKNNTVEKIKEVFKTCHEEGMLTHAYLMVGNKGECSKTIADTRRLLEEIKPFSSNICVTTPYPGTYLYEKLEEENLINVKTWDCYDHLISDTIHINTSNLDLATLNKYKNVLMTAQKYPIFRLRCLCKAFLNQDSIFRLLNVLWSNPGILFRGLRLFFKSIYSKGLDLSNPKTKAYEIYSEPES